MEELIVVRQYPIFISMQLVPYSFLDKRIVSFSLYLFLNLDIFRTYLSLSLSRSIRLFCRRCCCKCFVPLFAAPLSTSIAFVTE